MSRAVLAETGPLYAAADPEDAHHGRAHRELKGLARERRDVVVACPTMLEAYTLGLYRLGKQAASNWLNDILSGSALLNPNPEDYRAAIRRLAGLEDQPIALFDATGTSGAFGLDDAAATTQEATSSPPATGSDG